MATAKEIWETLSAINVNDKLEKKGKFSYLSWSWAWSKLMEHYPEAHHEILPDVVFSDETVEVRVSITIGEVERTCWLPVLNYQNKPIANPNAFDVNTARMRCLVKAIALLGLGTYVFSGEDLPQEPVVQETPEMIRAGAEINELLEKDDYHGAAQLWDEWDQTELQVIARAPSNGGQLTTSNRAKLKETAFRHALNEVRGIDMSGVGQ